MFHPSLTALFSIAEPTWKFDIDVSSVIFDGVEAIVGSCKRRICSQQSSTRSSKDAECS